MSSYTTSPKQSVASCKLCNWKRIYWEIDSRAIKPEYRAKRGLAVHMKSKHKY
jgi:hypothetical protein